MCEAQLTPGEGWPMASTTARSALELLPNDFRRILRAIPGTGGGARRCSSADMLAARSLASVGLAALLGLPFLMLASLALGAPFAGPAAIALGYFATAHALAAGRLRRAAASGLTVSGGLAGWAILVATVGGRPLSWMWLGAALLGPALAVAPALARRLIAGRRDAKLTAALARATCLDELAPSEAVLFLDRSGALLASTTAGRRLLRVSLGDDITSLFELTDRPRILEAIASCRACSRTEIVLRVAGPTDPAERRLSALFSPDSSGGVAMRISGCETASAARIHPCLGSEAQDAIAPIRSEWHGATEVCDLDEAVGFALRYVRHRADSRHVELIRQGESGLVAGCDRRLCRRMACLLMESAVGACDRGGSVRVAVRAPRGAILLRVTVVSAGGGDGSGETAQSALASSGAADLVEALGGTFLVDVSAAGATASVRLASGRHALAHRRSGEAREVSACVR
jgi:hypothetical protein